MVFFTETSAIANHEGAFDTLKEQQHLTHRGAQAVVFKLSRMTIAIPKVNKQMLLLRNRFWDVLPLLRFA